MAADRRVKQSNGAPKEPARQADDQTDENIFLFVPNLIGMSNRTTKARRPANQFNQAIFASC